MPKKVQKKTDEKIAQKSLLNFPSLIGKGLIFIGKPLYVLASSTILALLFLLYSIGHITRISSNYLTKTVRNNLKKLTKRKSHKKLKVKKVKVQKVKISKKITFPDFSKIAKIVLLKINLLLLRVQNKVRKIIKKPTRKRVVFSEKYTGPLKWFLIGISLGVVLIFSFWLLILRDLPSSKNLTQRQIDVSTKIYDRNGELLYKIYKDKNRTIVPLEKIPNQVRLATLAAEDAEFYSHAGISVRGIFRAFIQNLQNGNLQGGSTITQQLVKNALLTPERTVTRKVKEVILSFQVELNFTKDQILEMYLNEVSYGGTAYGIEEAARSYFGKDVENLNLAESAFLAGLPKSPTRYSPFGQDPNAAFARQKEVLHLMKVNRFINEAQEQEALNQRITFISNKTEIKAPHFVMYIRQLLVDTYGEEMVEKGGLEVKTTLDLGIQELAQKVVTEEVNKLKGLNVGNGAALVLDPKSGEVLAMVGSKDYFDTAHDGNVNVTLRPRQPGSSIKIVNYAYALSHGYTPASVIDDSPITYVTPGTTPYTPKNYDGKFKGKVSLRVALAESRNIPAVKILASYGVDKMIELGKAMGITTWEDPTQYGLSLTLGGGATKLLDLAQVYATVANYGERPNITPILEVSDYQGENLWESKFDLKVQAIEKRVAYMLIDILKDNNARAGEFGTNSYLVVKNHPEVAVKTGTSNDLRDNLTAGFNQDYLVVTWVGNNDNSPMSRIASGVTGASPIWNKIMSALLSDKPSIDWKSPEGLVKVNICTITGTLPCNGCPTKQEWFKEGEEPKKACSAETVKGVMEQRQMQENPGGQILDDGIRTQNP